MEGSRITIPSERGGISAVIHRPEAWTDRLAIFCPGYLDSKDYKHLIRLAERFASLGYTAVRFDPTGTWESAGEISDYTTTQTLRDIRDVIEFMLQEHEYKTILLGGHSRGGSLAILYAAEYPRITEVLGIMPSSASLAKDERERWRESDVRTSHRDLPADETKTREFRVPYSHLLDREKYDTLAAVGDIRVPVILVAGALDEVVSLESVKAIYERANEPKTLIVMDGIGHDYRHNEEEIGAVNERVIKALEHV